jgi:hypothetical protein
MYHSNRRTALSRKSLVPSAPPRPSGGRRAAGIRVRGAISDLRPLESITHRIFI